VHCHQIVRFHSFAETLLAAWVLCHLGSCKRAVLPGAGMIGCGLAADFGQLLAARCLTGVGSALQNTGAQLFLADISTTENRAQCLGTNQVRLPPFKVGDHASVIAHQRSSSRQTA